MDWDRLLADFKSLGGIADNVRIGEGERGRGIFVVDPSKAARVHVPENLLIATDDVELRDDQLVVKPKADVATLERTFFDNYQQQFGWGAGLSRELWRSQEAWSSLPPDIIQSLNALGALTDPKRRFQAPTADVCLYQYISTRDLLYNGKPRLAPVLEIANYSSRAAGFDFTNGVGVSGIFQDEVLVRYNPRDALANVLHYGFAERCMFAFSLRLTVDLPTLKVTIMRDIAETDVLGGIRFPRAQTAGNVVHLPYLQLGNSDAMDLPRGVFRKMMAPMLSVAQCDEVFESLAYHNKSMLLDLVSRLIAHDGWLIKTLETAAVYQLHTLSASVGARSL